MIVVHRRLREVVPVPSLADAGWLVAYPLFYLGIILLIRDRVPGLGGGLWLDGLIGALAVGAVSAAAVVPLLTGVHHVEKYPLSALFLPDRHRLPKVRVFLDFLVERFRDAPWRFTLPTEKSPA